VKIEGVAEEREDCFEGEERDGRLRMKKYKSVVRRNRRETERKTKRGRGRGRRRSQRG
jgi:hypothetical protein